MELFFVKPLLIASFSSLKSFYKIKRFFTDVSLSNNYLYCLIFPLQLPIEIGDFFIGNIFDFSSSILTELGGFFLKMISLLLLHLFYRARRFFASIKALVFLSFLIKLRDFLSSYK